MRQTLHVLRGILGKGVLNSRNGGELKVDGGRLTSDVQAFCLASQEGRPQDALSTVTGDFLSGFFVSRAEPFMAWVDQRRRSLNQRVLDAATRLAQQAEADRDSYQAIGWWHRALDIAPYDEGVVTNLVWALARSGNRGGAQAVYQRFRERMMDDLDLEPSLTTRVAVGHALRIPGSAPQSMASRRGRRTGIHPTP